MLVDWQKSSVLAALGADSSSTDGDVLRGAVPGELEGVVGVLANFLSNVGQLVIKDCLGSEGLEIVEVVRRSSRDNPQPRKFGELDTVNASCSATAVNEDKLIALLPLGG